MVSKRVFRLLFVAVLMLSLAAAGMAQNSSSQSPGEGPEASSSASSSGSSSRKPTRAELIAAGYLRTLWAAQQEYQKRNARYATSLPALVGYGSFTKRMANTDRRDYSVQFRSDGKKYSAGLVPKEFDDDHPAFYVDESGVVRSEQGKIASAESPEVRRTP